MAATEQEQHRPTPSPRGGRNIPVAIAVGLLLGGLFIGTAVLHPIAFLVFATINLGIALTELGQAFGATKATPPTLVALVALPVALFGAYYRGTDAQVLALVGGLVAGFVVVLVTHERGHTVSRMGALALMLLWVVGTASCLGLLLDRPQGYWFVIAPTALTVANDVGAYVVGRNLGRHKLAPAISPGKTWEGLAGAVVLTIAVSLLAIAPLVPGVDVPAAIVLAVVVVAAATLGDLAESAVKRDLGVKDLGSIFPGHGGVMDRIDALLFALPATQLVFLAFGI